MKNYDHKKIESKWQKEWEKKKIYQASDKSKKKKFYGLIEFPYPSGAGLHVGHIRSNTAMDIISRKRRMEGYNVLYPIGWDAFGLPTENYAIKTGIQPSLVTKRNTDTFRKQLKELGFSFDWSREVNTTDPAYYKWTQWIFLQFYKKGLAYKAKTFINWCINCKIGLANEEVVDGKCERCGGPTEKKEKEQWMLAITKYADRLDKDLDSVDYLEKIKIQQRNWIGRSEGSEIDFKVVSARQDLAEEKVKIFTTRADTLFGATYLVLAPEHELVSKLKNNISNWSEVENYIKISKKKDEQERTAEGKEKTGVELKGVNAINPVNQEEVSIWVADYVLPHYGTGAIMAVPAHDERDFVFANGRNMEIREVVEPKEKLIDQYYIKQGIDKKCYTGEGSLINSGEFSGMKTEDARKKITEFVGGKMVTKCKLRDWVFSRQRYWGEPIPLINCDTCGWVPVPDKDLPVVLPKVKSYVPTDTGESPLSAISKWVNVKCPKCKGHAKRETDTMPNWAGSSWYYLRYVDPKNKKEFASKKNLKYFTPVDWYNGGMEHTTLHLLYSRFWHKFLYDLKLVPTSEPYAKRTSHGMILATDGAKMSKSLGNTVDPKDIVKTYGADTIRLYEMFMGPFDQVVSWNTDSLVGPRRFLERVWAFQFKIKENKVGTSQFLVNSINLATSNITRDVESMKFNTAVSQLMILLNFFEKQDVTKEIYETFLQLLAPFAPHVTEEIWFNLGHKKSIHISGWPKFDKNLIKEEKIKIGVQINGKVRAELIIDADSSEEDVKKMALAHENISKFLEGQNPKRVIYVKNRLINIVL